MKVVILCGGKGTRLREETKTKPKPMAMIGDYPMVWHIMKIYSKFGFNDFVLCLGYKGNYIKKYFKNNESEFNIKLVDTGLETPKGARIKKVEKYIKEDSFMATYGDAVSTVDIHKLIDFHKKQKTLGTLTGIHPHSKWGLVKTNDNNIVEEFVEKPKLYDYVNGGFFVFDSRVFDYMNENDDLSTLDTDLLCHLAKTRQLSMYKHEGFWHCMDTFKDFQDLNKLWQESKPWKTWGI